MTVLVAAGGHRSRIAPGDALLLVNVDGRLLPLRGIFYDRDQSMGGDFVVQVDADLIDAGLGEGPLHLVGHGEYRWQMRLHGHLHDSGCSCEFDGGYRAINVQKLRTHLDRLAAFAHLHLDLDVEEENLGGRERWIAETLAQFVQADLPGAPTNDGTSYGIDAELVKQGREREEERRREQAKLFTCQCPEFCYWHTRMTI